MTARAWSALAAAATLLAGCAHLDPADYKPRTDPTARLSPQGGSPWRVDFGDPELAALLREADAGSLDVKIALARVARARADVAEAHAHRAPQVTIGGEAAGGGTDFHDARSAATPTFEAAYEVDLWGRLARAEEAAAYDGAAAENDVVAARLLVAAETVRAYAALRAAQAAADAATRRIATAERSLALTERRGAEGAVGPAGLATARAALAQAQAGLTSAREAQSLQADRLANLLGRSVVVVPAGPTLAGDLAAPAVAAEIVAQRPDVRAALSRLQAADARRAQAVAAAQPQFQITALLGAPDASIATLLDARALAWAVAASLTQSVLDGGAARARMHGASAEADVADLQYRKAVMAGWSEVRAALIDAVRARREVAAARVASEDADHAAGVVAARRQEGMADGLDAVVAEGGREAAQDQLQTARLAAVEARVRLALATGGL
jgi:multidrug efflux system outer membrane protein